jgi:pimeloyl-ACP methyl ester carboxylesterase
LAQGRSVVRFDHRGIGLSERDVTDISLEARVSDLVAVVEHCGAEDIDLLGTVSGGPVAISYAARNPTKVRRLILLDALARARDIQREPHIRALWPLIESEWDLFVRTQTLIAAG